MQIMDGWMRAVTQAERVKQNRTGERKPIVNNSNQKPIMQQPTILIHTKSNKTRLLKAGHIQTSQSTPGNENWRENAILGNGELLRSV